MIYKLHQLYYGRKTATGLSPSLSSFALIFPFLNATSLLLASFPALFFTLTFVKKGRKEGKKEGKERRKEGRKEKRKEGRKEGRKERRKKGRKEGKGGKEGREGRKTGRKEGKGGNVRVPTVLFWSACRAFVHIPPSLPSLPLLYSFRLLLPLYVCQVPSSQ
jgi:hypothetical protein